MLENLRLESFRGFKRQDFGFEKKSAVIGRNGSGKSSIIEAIRLLSVGKSFRTNSLAEAVSFDEKYFRLGATMTIGGQRQDLGFFYGSPFEGEIIERALTVGGKSIPLLDYLGLLPTVLFVPGDLEIILGPPQARRRYIDSILFQSSREFRLKHLELSGVLRERAALLFLIKTNRANSDELSPWDELLSNLTVVVRSYRQDYIKFINSWIAGLTNSGTIQEDINLNYEVGEDSLERVRSREITLSQNLFGPHRDEIKIDYAGRSSRRYASRGQSRIVLSVLKAAEVAYIETILAPPVVLLDDIFSELDQKNTALMLKLFSEETQIIVTATELKSPLKTWSVTSLE